MGEGTACAKALGQEGDAPISMTSHWCNPVLSHGVPGGRYRGRGWGARPLAATVPRARTASRPRHGYSLKPGMTAHSVCMEPSIRLSGSRVRQVVCLCFQRAFSQEERHTGWMGQDQSTFLKKHFCTVKLSSEQPGRSSSRLSGLISEEAI